MTATLPLAQDLFRAAYENRYTWDADFPGFSADITVAKNGETFTGHVTVGANLKPEITGFSNEEIFNAVKEQIWEITIHRVRRSFEDVHSKNTFTFGAKDEDGSQEIIVGGASAGDRYKIKNNVVSMVHRHIHGTVVTIDTLSVHDTGAGYLAHRYSSIYHNPETGAQIKPRQNFTDEYQEIGGYQILVKRTIEDENGTITFSLQNVSVPGASRSHAQGEQGAIQ
ncbi:MAG: hypothetical protein CV045_06510 [Cyanobacteria bacterium M5B4]|nr:MAG: hypothetical protein CV045_06510 [Cyanobacteria bacterium M5B4]